MTRVPDTERRNSMDPSIVTRLLSPLASDVSVIAAKLYNIFKFYLSSSTEIKRNIYKQIELSEQLTDWDRVVFCVQESFTVFGCHFSEFFFEIFVHFFALADETLVAIYAEGEESYEHIHDRTGRRTT